MCAMTTPPRRRKRPRAALPGGDGSALRTRGGGRIHAPGVDRSAEAILEALAENSQEQLVYLDRDFNFLRVNRAYAETCHKAPAEFIGHNHFEFYPHPENQAIFEHVRDTGEPAVWREKPFEFPDQPERGVTYWDWTLTPVKDRMGSVVGLVFSLRDVTETVRARRRAEESERQATGRAAELAVIFAAVDFPVITFNAQGAVVRVNPAACSVLGTDPTGLGAEAWARLVIDERGMHHVDGRPLSPPELPVSSALRGETVRRQVLHVHDAAGRELWLEATAIPLREGDRLVGATVAWHDVTERQRIEEALRRSEAQYRVLFETMSEGFCLCEIVCDDAGKACDLRYLEVNPGFERHTGLKAADVVGRTILQLFPDTEAVWLERYGKVALTGEPARFERRFGPLNRWFDVSAHRTSPGRFAVVFFDVTERKEAEERLRAANAQLVEADEHKNEFIATLSHELRNPLAPIKNSVYVLEHAAPGGDQARRALTIIDRQVSQLSHLVDDLLDMTRISSRKIQLRFQRLDLGELARHTAEDHRSLFEQNGVELEICPWAEPVYVDADRNRLAQVVGNLLVNAAKFCRRGGHTRLTVSAEAAAGRGTVRVEDDGVGMAPELLSSLFQAFRQADVTLNRAQGGLGLGLALAKGIVDLHGGEISARSAGPGQGSVFEVRLPLQSEGKEAPLPAPTPPGSLRRRVLVIEDNPDAAEALRDALELGGHDVAVVHDGPAGLTRAREIHPDVVLCDIGLPGMDGFEVARAFRADEGLRETALVALSAYALPADLRRASEAGFDRHLAKPSSLEQLEDLIQGLHQPASD
jgi:PAS domain S-box-containing protein